LSHGWEPFTPAAGVLPSILIELSKKLDTPPADTREDKADLVSDGGIVFCKEAIVVARTVTLAA
jgi:hypothetical protein